MLKAVILIGGPQKGTRFRPLSLELPKPLFPVAGFPIIYHHIEACSKLPDIQDVLLIGTYQPSDSLNRFITTAQREFKFNIRYLQEYTALGTAGGLYHFRDQILSGQPKGFLVFNGDVCCKFPLAELWDFHEKVTKDVHYTMLSTEKCIPVVIQIGKHFEGLCDLFAKMLAKLTQATREQSLAYGCLVENENTHEVMHYVEKPQTFVSSVINCGLYVFPPEIFQHIGKAFQQNQDEVLNGDPLFPSKDTIRLEQDIIAPLASTGTLFTFKTNNFWSQIKSAGSAIYANRLYLSLYHETHPDRLSNSKSETGPSIRGDVYIHPTATVDPTSTLGPNVTIAANVTIGAGVRVRESIVLEGATLQDHCCILHSIIGWNSMVGAWSRVEGTPNDPNPNLDHAKIDSGTLFKEDGKLNPSITILGTNVSIPPEVVVLNAILLPDKQLSSSFKNQILL